MRLLYSPTALWVAFLPVCLNAAPASDLFDAVRACEPGCVVELLIAGASSCEVRTPECITPLHLAAALNESQSAALLIGYGADPNARTLHGSTPLHWAASRDATAAATVLLEFGADPRAVNLEGVTALAWAQQCSATNTVRLLEWWNVDQKRRQIAAQMLNAPAQNSRRLSIRPYMGAISYSGSTERRQATVTELNSTLGYHQIGYVEASVVNTRLDTLPYVPAYNQYEYKLGGGLYLSPHWLLRSKGGYLDESLSADPQAGWIAGLGVDWLGADRFSPSITTFYAEYPAATAYYLTPRIVWNMAHWSLLTAVHGQLLQTTNGVTKRSASISQDLTVQLSSRSDVSFGWGFGRSPYAMRGFGDVLFNVSDAQTYSTHLGLYHRRSPLTLSLDTTLTGFEGENGASYRSLANVLCLGYDNLDQPAGHRAGIPRSPWTLEGGLVFRPLKITFRSRPPEPLLAAVIDPVTFYDDTLTYSTEYSYALETEAQGGAGSLSTSGAAPYVLLQRDWGRLAWGTAYTGMRYSFSATEMETDWEPRSVQTVRETTVARVLPSPFSLVSQPTVLSSSSRAYASYVGTSRNSLDVGQFELASSLGWRCRLRDWLHLAVEAGPTVALVHWRFFEETQWQASDNPQILQTSSRDPSSFGVAWGAESRARLLFGDVSGDGLFFSCFGGCAWFHPLDIAPENFSMRMDLGGLNAGVGLGLGLP